MVRLPIPQLTEERRKELVKLVRHMAEEGRVAVRNVRRDTMRHLEELVRNGDVGDDEERAAEGRVQKLTDEHVAPDRRAPEAQGSRDHGGLGPAGRAACLLADADARACARPPRADAAGGCRLVAMIMDGNGRWARRRGLPVAAGHRAGTRALRRTVEAAIDLGVHDLTVYAFSTENWSRSAGRGRGLMEIFGETIERELPDLAEQGVRVRFIGRRDRAPEELRARMAALEDRDRAEHAAEPLDRVRLRRAGRDRRSRAAARRERASTRARSTRTSFARATSTRPTCRTPTCWSGRAASSASRTSCSGSSPTPSSSSWTSCGPTSASATCARRSRSTRSAAGASAAGSAAW